MGGRGFNDEEKCINLSLQLPHTAHPSPGRELDGIFYLAEDYYLQKANNLIKIFFENERQ
jgi:hypothetical protein